MSETVIDIRSAAKSFGRATVLTDVSLRVEQGQTFAFLGRNGAGKTTTIRILAGLLKQTRGQASIAGVDVSGRRSHIRRLVGYMPDSFGVYDQMRVWEYLDFFGAAFKIPRRQRR